MIKAILLSYLIFFTLTQFSNQSPSLQMVIEVFSTFILILKNIIKFNN